MKPLLARGGETSRSLIFSSNPLSIMRKAPTATANSPRDIFVLPLAGKKCESAQLLLLVAPLPTVTARPVRLVRSPAAGGGSQDTGSLTTDGRRARKAAGANLFVIRLLLARPERQRQLHCAHGFRDASASALCCLPPASFALPLKPEQQGSSVHLCHLGLQQRCIRPWAFFFFH